MDNDDRQIGTILTRREVLKLFGVAGLGVLVGCRPTRQRSPSPTALPPTAPDAASATSEATATTVPLTAPDAASATSEATATTREVMALPSCVVRPAATEGPYYLDLDMLRSDVREDRVGTTLTLNFRVSQVSNNRCTPLQGALVEIWHCDANGIYSGVRDRFADTTGQSFLRGGQMTDRTGLATFSTLYPGWYPGRAVHIHFKVFPTSGLVFTSQLFFPEPFTDQLFSAPPYAAKGQRTTLNSNDGIYRAELLLSPTINGDGVEATFDIGMEL
ncbi:MAG: intradiol ring-cleavage dioxygenase [Ardenticatenales bacterium]|nr:intradiol ring-cleavage dioxygenase [Ardenticatenales bacterium]